jgi:hypothetical protein
VSFVAMGSFAATPYRDHEVLARLIPEDHRRRDAARVVILAFLSWLPHLAVMLLPAHALDACGQAIRAEAAADRARDSDRAERDHATPHALTIELHGGPPAVVRLDGKELTGRSGPVAADGATVWTYDATPRARVGENVQDSVTAPGAVAPLGEPSFNPWWNSGLGL